jgi:hypothetical protein
LRSRREKKIGGAEGGALGPLGGKSATLEERDGETRINDVRK